MEKKESITIILGAGFSFNAGLPLANRITEFFTRDNTDKILAFGSGEFKWVDFANDAELTNGRLAMDHFAYGYILNALVAVFVKKVGDFTNYEDFYQFVIDNASDRLFLDSLLREAKINFIATKPNIEKNPFKEQYFYAFEKYYSRAFI